MYINIYNILYIHIHLYIHIYIYIYIDISNIYNIYIHIVTQDGNEYIAVTKTTHNKGTSSSYSKRSYW